MGDHLVPSWGKIWGSDELGGGGGQVERLKNSVDTFLYRDILVYKSVLFDICKIIAKYATKATKDQKKFSCVRERSKHVFILFFCMGIS